MYRSNRGICEQRQMKIWGRKPRTLSEQEGERAVDTYDTYNRESNYNLTGHLYTIILLYSTLYSKHNERRKVDADTPLIVAHRSLQKRWLLVCYIVASIQEGRSSLLLVAHVTRGSGSGLLSRWTYRLSPSSLTCSTVWQQSQSTNSWFGGFIVLTPRAPSCSLYFHWGALGIMLVLSSREL